jgi:predicted Zn-dependent peptidase
VKSNPLKLIKNGGKKGVLPLIINMLNELHEKGTTEKEIELTKNYLKGSMNSNLEKNSLYTNYNGSYMLLYSNKRDYVPYEDLYHKYYENISINDVNETIKKYLIKSRLNVCVLGKNLPSQNSIKKECEKLIV